MSPGLDFSDLLPSNESPHRNIPCDQQSTTSSLGGRCDFKGLTIAPDDDQVTCSGTYVSVSVPSTKRT